MCGVFGFVSRGNRPINLGILKQIARVTQRRGRDAWGMAWIDGRGRMHSFKQTGPVADHIGLLAMAHDARVLIGHCRFATRGDADNNLNNHPHPADGGWIVHNGVIRNYDSMLQRFQLWPTGDCDSEVLGLLIEQVEGTLLERCIDAVCAVEQSPLVLLGLWKPGTLIAVRQDNPLHVGKTGRGFYLASLADGLPGRVSELPNNQAVEFGEEIKHGQTNSLV